MLLFSILVLSVYSHNPSTILYVVVALPVFTFFGMGGGGAGEAVGKM